MRGDDAVKGSFFSYIDLEKRVRSDHPLRLIREIANAALRSLMRDFAALHADRAGVDPAGAAAAGAVAAGLLFDSLGAATGRADRHRPIVPLVCRAGDRGTGVERDELHPKTATGSSTEDEIAAVPVGSAA